MFCLGLPEILDEDVLAAETNLVRSDARPRAVSNQQEELVTKPSQLSDADIDTLRSRFPI